MIMLALISGLIWWFMWFGLKELMGETTETTPITLSSYMGSLLVLGVFCTFLYFIMCVLVDQVSMLIPLVICLTEITLILMPSLTGEDCGCSGGSEILLDPSLVTDYSFNNMNKN